MGLLKRTGSTLRCSQLYSQGIDALHVSRHLRSRPVPVSASRLNLREPSQVTSSARAGETSHHSTKPSAAFQGVSVRTRPADRKLGQDDTEHGEERVEPHRAQFQRVMRISSTGRSTGGVSQKSAQFSPSARSTSNRRDNAGHHGAGRSPPTHRGHTSHRLAGFHNLRPTT
jgi:hypothetical protein